MWLLDHDCEKPQWYKEELRSLTLLQNSCFDIYMLETYVFSIIGAELGTSFTMQRLEG